MTPLFAKGPFRLVCAWSSSTDPMDTRIALACTSLPPMAAKHNDGPSIDFPMLSVVPAIRTPSAPRLPPSMEILSLTTSIVKSYCLSSLLHFVVPRRTP